MTSSAGSVTRILGTLRSEEGAGVVRIEDRLEFGVDEVWSALTEPSRLAQWVGEVTGDLHQGGEWKGSFTSGWEGAGRVDTCDSARLLELTMDLGEEDENYTRVTLEADGRGTVVVVDQWRLPLDYLAAFAAGLQVHVEDLASHLRGGERCDTKARWDELIPGYKEQAEQLA